jgi:hypothetical protein
MTAVAKTATRKKTKPKQIKLREPITFTCTLAYVGSSQRVQLTWTPNEPTDVDYCVPGDTINFESPNLMSILRFGKDSPFEATKHAKDYTVNQGETLPKKVNTRFLGMAVQDFEFACLPEGVALPYSGGTVPVGGGGNKLP